MDELVTQRLRLRRFTSLDEDNLVELDGDPAVMRYLTGGSPTPRAVIRNEILPLFMSADPKAPSLGFWAAEPLAEREFLGWFSLRLDADESDSASLGYRLKKRVWGQGFATEGSRALIRAAFAEGHIERLRATTYEDNAASISVMQKLGMRFARSYRMTDDDLQAVDTSRTEDVERFPGLDVEYVLERSDWPEHR
ncbi:MAG: GNAT family N-acetyltransferase [Pseudomonadota bacterium]